MPGGNTPVHLLPDCPDKSVLMRLISGDLANEEALILESHLTNCERCRGKIEDLGDVSSIEALADEVMNTGSVESPSLRGVMERLLIESQLMNGSVNFTASPSRDVLPTLQPSARPGYIGRLGDIDIRRVIGRGGMGVVFEGEDSILNRTVAVKVLSPHLVGDGEAKNRFLREARAAAALTHENVVSIHSINEADGMPYLVLQYVDGEPLSERLKREGQLPFDDVLRLGIETARGLAAAHKRGLIHRDIKPANILLDSESGASRITDFGLVKRVDSDSITKLGSIAGTPAYMSPEQSTSDSLDARSDLFSLGVVLYESSTGVSPFAAESPFVTLHNIRTHQPTSVCKLNADLPAWFGVVVAQLLAKRPEDRIESANALVESLEQRIAKGRRSLHRHRSSFRLWASTAAVILLFAFGIYAVSNRVGRSGSNGSPSVSAPSHTKSGFVVDGQSQAYAKLAEAIEAASDNSQITVFGNGPFLSSSIAITGKNLTIQAAAGFIPHILPDESSGSVTPRLLASDSALRLEGLDIHWPIESPPIDINSTQLGFDDASERCVIGTVGFLQVSHCRIRAGRFGTCLGARSGEIKVTHSHLISSSGVGLAWRPTVSNVSVEHCQIESKVAFFFRSSVGASERTTGRFSSNNVISERIFSVITVNANRHPVEMHFSNNVLDSQVVASVFSFGGFRPFQENKMTETLREVIAWYDDSNVYQEGVIYLAVNPVRQPLGTLSSNLDSLDEWLTFWSQPNSKSIEGKIVLTKAGSELMDAVDASRCLLDLCLLRWARTYPASVLESQTKSNRLCIREF